MNTAKTEPLIPSSFLFRLSAPCHKVKKLWSKQGVKLPESHRVLSFGELDGGPVFADLRAGWNEDGLAFWLSVRDKRKSTWCRDSRITESDGLHLCIDTRDTHTIHRATRFCHRVALAPFGGGRHGQEPVARMIPINRAREGHAAVASSDMNILGEERIDGYVLHAHLPAATLTGFDPAEHPRLGFHYVVLDRELGSQTFSLDATFPIQEDPSLWGTLELVD